MRRARYMVPLSTGWTLSPPMYSPMVLNAVKLVLLCEPMNHGAVTTLAGTDFVLGATIELYNTCLGAKPCRYRYGDHPHSCLVQGPTALHGTSMQIPDLRAGFSYVIAALVGKGASTIEGAQYVERGYSHIPDKIERLGGRCQVVKA